MKRVASVRSGAERRDHSDRGRHGNRHPRRQNGTRPDPIWSGGQRPSAQIRGYRPWTSAHEAWSSCTEGLWNFQASRGAAPPSRCDCRARGAWRRFLTGTYPAHRTANPETEKRANRFSVGAEGRFLSHWKPGWGARIRTWEWRIQSPLPYRLATPHRGGPGPYRQSLG